MSQTPSKPLRIAVLLSGSGTTLENLLVLSAAHQLPAEIVFVLSSRADAYGLERAKQRGIPTAVVERKRFVLPEEFSDALFEAVRPHRPDLICLAGFLSLLKIPAEYAGRVLNIHPALLPSFGGKGYYGNRVHEAVLKHGCKVAGCTVHFVDNEYDHGPIVAQRAVAVLEGDDVESLAARVQEAEREVYPEAIRLYAAGRLRLEDRRVRVLPG
ncbi:MAG: phosphoribosylglycinamide formyltransferase [Planctomycetes bacterium]|nr:phosphoribosylglycinamide formyltransferase [Planctomycetota bacterium]